MEDESLRRAEQHSDSEEPECLLYHYTDQNGLLGILNSKSIWATHVRFLNDASEFIHGINIAKQCVKATEISLESVLRDYPSDELRQYGSRRVWEAMSQPLISMLDQIHKLPAYVACFYGSVEESAAESRIAGDNLGQWRAYSKESTGFSIGFDRRVLREHIKSRQSDPEDLLLFGDKCTYEEDKQREAFRTYASDFGAAIKECITRAWQNVDASRYFSGLDNDIKKRTIDYSTARGAKYSARLDDTVSIKEALSQQTELFSTTVRDTAVRILVEAVFMKNPAFCDENEWRIAKILGPDPVKVRFRPGKSTILPYIAIPLPVAADSGLSLVKRIVVGPSPEMENAVAAVKMFLISKGYKVSSPSGREGVEVLPSGIPYRAW